MGSREELHEVLVAILNSDLAYFQPPESLKLEYPCIVYKRDTIEPRHADNVKYSQKTRYQVIVIDTDPDSSLPWSILELPLCSHDRNYAKDGLTHDVFDLYY